MTFLLTSITCALLGALGGSQNSNKLFRRLGIPLVITLGVMFKDGFSYFNLLPMLCLIPLSMGYGEDNWLRKLTRSNAATRGIIGALGAAPLLFLAGPSVLFIPLMYIMWGAIVPREFVLRQKIFGRQLELLGEDILIYWSYGLGVL